MTVSGFWTHWWNGGQGWELPNSEGWESTAPGMILGCWSSGAEGGAPTYFKDTFEDTRANLHPCKTSQVTWLIWKVIRVGRSNNKHSKFQEEGWKNQSWPNISWKSFQLQEHRGWEGYLRTTRKKNTYKGRKGGLISNRRRWEGTSKKLDGE